MSSSYGVLDEEEGIARRATFLIDPKGIVRFSCVHDGAVGRSVEETKRVLDALQFADEYGQGCPGDWQKGQQGVRMDRWDYVAPKPTSSPPHPMERLEEGGISPKETPTEPKKGEANPKPRRPQDVEADAHQSCDIDGGCQCLDQEPRPASRHAKHGRGYPPSAGTTDAGISAEEGEYQR